MSVLDRWLSPAVLRQWPAATSATSATSAADRQISAALGVAAAVRQAATPGRPSQAVAAPLRQAEPQKSAIPGALSQMSQMSQMSQGTAGATPDEFEERAAVVEYEAGVPRAWAEGFARLDPDRPPDGVVLQRWRLFVDDCGTFLDGGWAAKAAALGWSAEQVFAVHPMRPAERHDAAGLVWLLHGDRIVALSPDEAMVETRSGGRHRIRRVPTNPGVVVWELVS